jgi:hypothetical protein
VEAGRDSHYSTLHEKGKGLAKGIEFGCGASAKAISFEEVGDVVKVFEIAYEGHFHPRIASWAA